MSDATPGSASPRATSPLAPLRHPVFRAIWIASVVSHIGSYMTDVGQGWLMATLAPSPLLVALLLTAESLPFFALGLPAGALADIVDRRKLLLTTQLAMSVVLASLAAATMSGAITPRLLLLLAFTLGTATALNDPAWHATVPELLPKEDLPGGVTLNAVGINIARTLGPALGGFIVAAAGPAAVFVIDATTFLGVVIVLATWRRKTAPAVLPAERMLGAVRAGFRYARHSKELQRVLLRAAAFMLCGSGVMALMPVLALETGRGPIALGLLLGAFGVGAVGGATLLPRMRARASIDGLISGGSLLFAVVAFAAAAFRSVALLAPMLAAAGVAWIAVLSSLNVAAQEASPPWVKARALAVYLIVFQASIAIGSALWGAVAARWGLGAAYAGIGAALAAGVLALARVRIAGDSSLDHTPAHHWPEPELDGEPPLEAGPVMVLVEYTVDGPAAAAFRAAMDEVGRRRRRYGAVSWSLFQDTAAAERFVESWVEETWAEHLRHHERVSAADREVEDAARRLLRPGTEVRIRHLVAGTARPETGAAVRVADAQAGGGR
jgi:predicted MFS family arabinose efflux permease